MWKKFPKIKPESKGWYQCTVEVEGQQRYVMNLYWYPDRNKFIDNIRNNVCESYEVMSDGKRVTDIGQDRTKGVVAWRRMPKPYMKGFIKEDRDSRCPYKI